MKLDSFRLSEAMLDLASREYVGLKPKDLREYKEHRRAEAAEWFDSDSRAPGSFLWCCDMLCLDAEQYKLELLAQLNA